MRRLIFGAATTAALLAALAVGPFGAAGAVPYVYACLPATYSFPNTYTVQFIIYNGSASTANLTTKVLTGSGVIRGGFLPPTWTLPATKTRTLYWPAPIGAPDMSDDIIPASVRIVSNVPVAATLSHGYQMNEAPSPISIPCLPLQP